MNKKITNIDDWLTAKCTISLSSLYDWCVFLRYHKTDMTQNIPPNKWLTVLAKPIVSLLLDIPHIFHVNFFYAKV